VSSLVYHAGALGDFVAALPALAAWKRARGGGPLILLGRPAHAALAAGVVDGAWDAGGARLASLFAGRPSPEVRALLADVRSALVFAPAGAGIVWGLEIAGVRGIVRQDPFPRERVHVVDYHLSLFPDLELSAEERMPRIEVPAGPGPAAAPTERLIVIHPGSGSPSKNWPIDRFVALARALRDRGPIAWVIGPAEEDAGFAPTGAGGEVWRSLTLPELAWRFAGARLLVGNDSGVAHLAAAVGCPVVVLFGASDPMVWAPRGRSVTVVGDGTCGMDAIDVAAVAHAARTVAFPAARR
jgi:ADP-heptose:LPS heptosyltransferase